MDKNKIQSYHNFLFPFKWELTGQSKRTPLAKRAPVEAIENKKLVDSNYWQKHEFDFKVANDSQTYNNYFYFYEAVRDVLNLEQNKAKNKQEHNIIAGLQYQYVQLKENSKYVIQLKSGEKYELNIEAVLLNFYENGVGVITFQLYNEPEKEETKLKLEDILKIDDYGRRVCPQFLGTEKGKPFTDAPKNNFLANSILK